MVNNAKNHRYKKAREDEEKRAGESGPPVRVV